MRFEFPPYADIQINLSLNTHLTIVRGDSGTGKSLLCKTAAALRAAGKLPNVYAIDFTNHVAFAFETWSTFPKGSLFIFDNMEFLPESELLKLELWIASCVQNNSSFYFLLFNRSVTSLPTSLENFALMQIKNDGNFVILTLVPAENWGDTI